MTKVDLGINSVGPDGAEALSRALAVNTTIKEFNLYFNPIGDQGGIALAQVRSGNK